MRIITKFIHCKELTVKCIGLGEFYSAIRSTQATRLEQRENRTDIRVRDTGVAMDSSLDHMIEIII